ncbi:hypothetical protein DH2020_013635 [Rehmannia glutinosa]|uniref:Glycosyltransferase 61 catalytic domain-containing protein n=1 Tax=Rehmannia glutinosa TaxID=99300 RepID=A0ABR0X2Z1_REHGL
MAKEPNKFSILPSLCEILTVDFKLLMFVAVGDGVVNLQLSIDNVEDDMLIADDERENSEPKAIEKKKLEPLCKTSNYCEIEGDIRIQPNSSTIFVLTTSNSTNSLNLEPYPRKNTFRVKKWTIKQLRHKDENAPKCTQNLTTHPAILFSIGGFSGNYFHDFADVLFPLFSTSFHFRKEARFLISDYKPWWVNKFRQILDHLTKHDLVDIDREKLHTFCYSKMIFGLKFYKELIFDPSLSKSAMRGFRRELRRVYTLERNTAIRDGAIRPRLMIVSRNRTRILTNVDDVLRLARTLGYEVVLAEAGVSTNVTRFAQTVNSCDVLMGIHGAGRDRAIAPITGARLTNMLFLPDNAVLIQVVPFGGIDKFARLDFGNPSAGMNIRYLEYKITVNESSLSQQYSSDDPILKHPESYKGWNAVQSIYLDKQNVTIDLDRFKGTLAKALKLLRH